MTAAEPEDVEPDAADPHRAATDLPTAEVGGGAERPRGSRPEHPPIDEIVGDGASRPVDRIVATYVVASAAWIGVTSLLAGPVARHTPVPLAVIELGKGALFVVVTGLVLRHVLRRWTRRVTAAAAVEARAARAEHRAAEQLREAEAIRVRFLRGISHELRTPLTNIVGYGLTINARLGQLQQHEIEYYTDRLVANARRLERLVLDLLDLERLDADLDVRVQRDAVRLDRLASGALEGVPVVEHVVHVEAEAATVMLDRARTERMLAELVRNATRHTPDGTQVWVRVAVDGPLVRLTVEDDGPGVPPDLSLTLFEPFTQGPAADTSASPGIGIGLALVARYAKLQGGTVSLDDRPGGGTRFTVELPTHADARTSPR